MAQTPWITVAGLRTRFDIKEPRGKTVIRLRSAAEAACGMVEEKIGQILLETEYIRRFDGIGSRRIDGSGIGADRQPLPFPPIRALNSVTIDGAVQVLGDADQGFDDKSLVFHDFDGYMLRLCGWPAGRLNVRVDWVAGLQVSEIKPHLISATQTIAMLIYKELKRVGDLKHSAGRGGSTTFTRQLMGVEADALKLAIDDRPLFVDRGVPLPGDGGSQFGQFEFGGTGMG